MPIQEFPHPKLSHRWDTSIERYGRGPSLRAVVVLCRLTIDMGGSIINQPTLDKMAAIFADDILKCISMNEKNCISIQISLKFVPKGPIDNKWALVQVMAWRRIGDKPLPETMLIQFADADMRH